jgi:Rrf2 family protein
MVSKTTISAIRALLYLTRCSGSAAISPRRVAAAIGESPSYLSKITRELVKAGILRAEKGAKGGVRLSRAPSQISLLSIVEACQGTMLGNYCQAQCEPADLCSWHHAASELQGAVVGVLSRWNLEQLSEKPFSTAPRTGEAACVMGGRWAERGEQR